jgi:hypothetical protein
MAYCSVKSSVPKVQVSVLSLTLDKFLNLYFLPQFYHLSNRDKIIIILKKVSEIKIEHFLAHSKVTTSIRGFFFFWMYMNFELAFARKVYYHFSHALSIFFFSY